MNKITRESIAPLLQPDGGMTLSIYFPTHRSPTSFHVQEDKTRFKNSLKAGEIALVEAGAEAAVAHKIISQLEEEFWNDDDFWQHTTEGLAVFASLAETRFYHLPMECDERVSAGEHYDSTPLLVLLSYDVPYYLLALAVHGPELYRGDMYGVEPVKIDLPESPEKALNIDEMFSNSQTVRAGGGYGAGNPGSGSHGQGDSRQAGQEERLKFFRIIDEKIIAANEGMDKTPLLLAGSEDEVSEYKDVSRNKHLLDPSLSGNYTASSGVNTREIFERSWRIIDEALGEEARSSELERFGDFTGVNRSTTMLSDIRTAAEEGRVDSLLVAMLAVTRDTVSDSIEPRTKLVFPADYDKDMLDACGRTVFSQGGKIIGLTEGAMPNKAGVAAIFRY